MKATVLLCCVIAVALLGLSCPLDTRLGISVTEDSLSISVTEVEDGVMIENLSGITCIVFVRSPEGEQQFELGVGESVTVTGLTNPIEVAGVKC